VRALSWCVPEYRPTGSVEETTTGGEPAILRIVPNAEIAA
jgi:hypothetical protein